MNQLETHSAPSAPRQPALFVLALAATMMLGPFSLDTYLPAFPAIAASLGISTQQVALSVSVYIFALAFGMLIGGALSDRYGRKPILAIGLLIYVAASLALAASTSLELLLGGRALQALGGGWALVSVPALVRDRVEGVAAAKLFSLLGLVMVLAPGIAPTLGGALLQVGPWNLIFVFLALYGLLLIPLLARGVFVTSRAADPAPPAEEATSLLGRYLEVLRHPTALPFIAWQVGAFSVMMLFVTHGSFIYQEHFGQSEGAFGALFAVNVGAMFLCNLLNRALLSRIPVLRLLQGATIAQALGVILVLMAAVLRWPLVVFTPALAIAIGTTGAITPNIQALFMQRFPRSGGTAAALLGASQFGLAGLITGLSTLLPHTLVAITLAMGGCSAFALIWLATSLSWPRARVLEEVPS